MPPIPIAGNRRGLMRIAGCDILLEKGDITTVKADAIVNAANSGLRGGGGVDGAIHRAGGPAIMEELASIRERVGTCPTGDAVVTGAGNLPAKWIIHAVGPVWRGGKSNEEEKLRKVYQSSLECARKCEASSIAFCSISTGIYGYPIERAALVALKTVVDHCEGFREVRFVLFSEKDLHVYQDIMNELEGRNNAN